jgi:5-methylcytosine-specific restriction protein A
MIGKQCREPNCPGIAYGYGKRYCEEHKEKEIRKTWGMRREEKLSFHGTRRHQKLRLVVLRRDPICKICDSQASTVADHILPAREYPELKWKLDNLQGLCRSCHNKKTISETRARNERKK